MKTDSPLSVDPYAVLTGPIPPQLLEAVTRGRPEIPQCRGRIQHPELSQSDTLHVDWQPPKGLSLEEALGVTVPKALDQANSNVGR